MTNRVTPDAWVRFTHRLVQVVIVTVFGLALIALPACSDDDHHDGDGHAPADHEQMDQHMDDRDAPSMDELSDQDHDAADDHEH